jgi:hypothetical protein
MGIPACPDIPWTSLGPIIFIPEIDAKTRYPLAMTHIAIEND